jgi:hypothetical protein
MWYRMSARTRQVIARDAWAVGNGATSATLSAGMRRTSAPVKNGGGARSGALGTAPQRRRDQDEGQQPGADRPAPGAV